MTFFPNPIGLFHQAAQVRVNICRISQIKMNAEPQFAKILDSNQSRMINATLKPQTSIQPLLPHNNSRESNPGLKNDPGLLRINSHRPAFSCQLHERIERLPDLRGFAAEMIRDFVSSAGMPQVRRDKFMAAMRAAPKRLLRLEFPEHPVVTLHLLLGKSNRNVISAGLLQRFSQPIRVNPCSSVVGFFGSSSADLHFCA
jgi:hypothetical protein